MSNDDLKPRILAHHAPFVPVLLPSVVRPATAEIAVIGLRSHIDPTGTTTCVAKAQAVALRVVACRDDLGRGCRHVADGRLTRDDHHGGGGFRDGFMTDDFTARDVVDVAAEAPSCGMILILYNFTK